MNKESYLQALSQALIGKTTSINAGKIMEYYEQYFDDGVDLGKTEAQIAEELGAPKILAEEVLAGMQLKACDIFESSEHVRMIDMTLIDIRVHLIFSEREVVSITYQGIDEYDPQLLSVEYISNHLRIIQKADRVMQWRQNQKPYLLVELPQTYKGKLLFETRDSRIIVDGKAHETRGQFHLYSKHGRIECDSLVCKDAEIATGDGRIELTRCQLKTVNLESLGGRITVDKSRMKYLLAKSQAERIEINRSHIELAELESVTGRIVVNDSWVDDCRMESDDGRITYTLFDNTKGLHLDLLSRQSKVMINGKQVAKGILLVKDLKPKKKEKRYLNVYARTSSGRIEIEH